ncbi:hypothetical protein DVR12_10810 [Chitinophaga silvatica]|uniref:Collagen triple helix repeat-containing protein n=1 Tax=Chitinophaga silvatica TaxID=2282649 RepID=A0A3E1YBU1_9BACT|nr:hypothetical protein [Chitinophaga silvatica]RFS23495.1 hypothetical protein DVR12_10810 [Chitinophaga silvatica]
MKTIRFGLASILYLSFCFLLSCSKDGAQGPQGNTGPQGSAGPQGIAGAVGPAGKNGSTIYAGEGVPANSVGQLGDYYLDKNTGILYGPKKSSGWDALISLKGDKGNTGAQGTKGEKGDKGDTGAQGTKGEKGDKGDTGTQGTKGEKGDKGDTGAQGTKGEKGDKGDTGTQGTKGEKGDKGDTGAQGTKGEKGDKGDTGAQGTKGEKGDKGDTGAQGTKGEKGDKGDTGAQGTKGEKGDKGDTGAQGTKGEKGDKGDTGAQGTKGEKGDKGDTGAQGTKGEKGDKGDTGAQGSNGEKGEKGDKGSQIYSGDLPPDNSIGAVGDYYLDKTNHILYGPKTAEGWGFGLDMSSASNAAVKVFTYTSPNSNIYVDKGITGMSNLQYPVHFDLPSIIDWEDVNDHGAILVYYGFGDNVNFFQWLSFPYVYQGGVYDKDNNITISTDALFNVNYHLNKDSRSDNWFLTIWPAISDIMVKDYGGPHDVGTLYDWYPPGFTAIKVVVISGDYLGDFGPQRSNISRNYEEVKRRLHLD